MTLQQLIYFREIAHTLHFNRAAENLYVAQSSLSHAIQTLEREIGAPLFIRQNGRQIILTDYGKVFLPYVEKMLTDLQEGQDRLDRMLTTRKGQVNIAYSFINGCTVMPELFKAFYSTDGNAEIELQSVVNHGGTNFIEDHLNSGTADLALSCAPFKENSRITSKIIFRQQLYAVLPSGHELAGREYLTIQDIKDEKLIMISDSLSLYDHVKTMYAENGLMPKMTDGSTDWSAQMDLIACGRGIGIMPEIPYSSGSVTFVELRDPGSLRDVYLLWPSDRKLSPAAAAFREFCLEYF